MLGACSRRAVCSVKNKPEIATASTSISRARSNRHRGVRYINSRTLSTSAQSDVSSTTQQSKVCVHRLMTVFSVLKTSGPSQYLNNFSQELGNLKPMTEIPRYPRFRELLAIFRLLNPRKMRKLHEYQVPYCSFKHEFGSVRQH